MATPTTVDLSARQVFAIRDFRLLWLAYLISEFGNGLTSIGLIILVTSLTGATFSVATMALAIAIPQVVFGLASGVFVDRFNSKHVMVVSDSIRGLLVLGFIPAALSGQLWIMYLLGFAQATVGTFFDPARMSMMPAVVPENGLMAANSMTQTGRVAANILGAGVVGVLLGLMKISWPIFVLDSITFFTSVFLVAAIRTRVKPSKENDGEKGTFWAEFKEGIMFIVRSPKLIGVIIAVGIADLGLGATQILFPLFFQKDLHISAAWLGPDELVLSIAMAISGSLVVLLAAKVKPELLSPLGLLTVGIATGLVAAVSSIWLVLILTAVTGLALLPMQTSVSTIFQRSSTREIRGRVGAAIGTVSESSRLLSIVAAGLLADLIGVRMMFLMLGLIVMLAGIAAWWLFRSDKPQTIPATQS
jgi:MFS transporter, DHA3 family, macrolide efflux protein